MPIFEIQPFKPLDLTRYFNSTDPRIKKKIRHKLDDIVVIAICAAICGSDDWVFVEACGKAKYDWLKTFLELPHGVPSHDTFGNVFSVISASEFEE